MQHHSLNGGCHAIDREPCRIVERVPVTASKQMQGINAHAPADAGPGEEIMKMLCANVGRGEHRCYIGSELVGVIHRVGERYVPEVFLKPWHVRFCRWVNSVKTAQAVIAMVLREKI